MVYQCSGNLVSAQSPRVMLQSHYRILPSKGKSKCCLEQRPMTIKLGVKQAISGLAASIILLSQADLANATSLSHGNVCQLASASDLPSLPLKNDEGNGMLMMMRAMTVKNFDPTRYAGRWFEVASLKRGFAGQGQEDYTQARNHHEPEKAWFQNICKGTENVAKLHFYVQDVLGVNSTVYEVARASITSNSPTTFGQVRVVDDLLTAEPDYNSEKVGRIQGLITSADLETSALAMNLNFVFTSGEYNGSTITMLGRNQIDDAERELAVVGGTGVFRGARGYAITSTYSYDVETSYGVLEYTLYVTYVDGSGLGHHQASK